MQPVVPGAIVDPRGFGQAAVQRSGGLRCDQPRNDIDHEHGIGQHRDDVRSGAADRTDEPAPEADSDHACAGQCPISAKFVGDAGGGRMRYRTSVSAELFAESEPDRAVLAIDQEGGVARTLLREFRGIPSRDRRSDAETSERGGRQSHLDDDIEVPDLQ